MLFSSIPFIYGFLPIFFVCYFLCPVKGRNFIIVIFSLLFYGWQEKAYLFLMLFVIAEGFIFAIILEKLKSQRYRKYMMMFAAGSYLITLGYFKYMNFFLDNLRYLFQWELAGYEILLPVGISFYIFQMMSYNIDVYRNTTKAQKNPITVAAYISMFPQLIAGPIVRYKDIEEQLIKREHSFEKIRSGMKRFAVGLGKKVLLANQLGELCDLFRQSTENSVLFVWMYGIGFMLHIYYDFSGYSDMAIGMAKIMGFELMENFNYPYISRSITEFWRRWHISLGTWFRDYVYIPMGGNRVSRICFVRNIFVVWFLTGFWHGAAWNFILWGLFFAFWLLLEKKILWDYLKDRKVLSHGYVLFLAMVSFLLFDAYNVTEAWKHSKALFGIGTASFAGKESIFYFKNYFVLFFLSAFGATPYGQKAFCFLKEKAGGEKYGFLWETAGTIFILLLSTAYLVDGSFNPFLYFRF